MRDTTRYCFTIHVYCIVYIFVINSFLPWRCIIYVLLHLLHFFSQTYHRRSLLPHSFLTFCFHIYFQSNVLFLFHFFFLNLDCSCPYSCNPMLTTTYMCRLYIYYNYPEVWKFKNRVTARFGYDWCTLFPLCNSN